MYARCVAFPFPNISQAGSRQPSRPKKKKPLAVSFEYRMSQAADQSINQSITRNVGVPKNPFFGGVVSFGKSESLETGSWDLS